MYYVHTYTPVVRHFSFGLVRLCHFSVCVGVGGHKLYYSFLLRRKENAVKVTLESKCKMFCISH